MNKERAQKCVTSSLHRVFAVLLVVCFVQCATGSCLSYGHSCWGAHGKRSGKPPASAPDWYITRLLRRMAENDDVNQNHGNRAPLRDTDLSAIFQTELDDTPSTDKINDNDGPAELPFSKNEARLEAKPMLDDNVLSKLKMWHILRDSAIRVEN